MSENGATTGSGSRLNPFTRRDTHSSQSILLYKITTAVSYIILLVTAIYYTFNKPHEGHHPHRKIWGNNLATPFAQNSILTSLYWLALFILQIVYYTSFFSSNATALAAAANIAPHYIASNLLLFGFIHLWVRSHIWLSLLLLVVNFFNLSTLYFRIPNAPRWSHIATVSGPLAWNFVALYWVGAVAVGTDRLAARIVANIFIWGFLAYGLFFLAAFKDYTIGFALSVLSFSTGVGQFLTKLPILQLQWIFAFTIGAILFLVSAAVASGKDPINRGAIVSEDRERAPLLEDERV